MANEDKATRYNRVRRWTSVAAAGASAAGLGVLLASGVSAALRDWAHALAPAAPWFGVAIYGVALAGFVELIQAPFAFYGGVTLERRYGLSTQSVAGWLADLAKGALLGVVVAALGALLVRWLTSWSPDHWWLAAAAVLTVFMIAVAVAGPVLLLPLFYRFTPLARAELRARLMALVGKAGTSALGVYEWKLGNRTRKANAALTGLGRTVRILVSDTLLAEHSDDEVEVILAHELAHHVHRDLWVALAVEAAVVLLACFLADRVLSAAVGAYGIVGKSDVAGLPVLLLAGAAARTASLPVTNALSRSHERRADRFALAMTRNVPAFVSAMRRLATQNLSEDRPSRWVEILFLTHPTCASRIASAHAWERAEDGGPG